MKRIIGYIFSVIAWLMYIFGGLFSLIICVGIVKMVFGKVISYLALFVFPMMIVIAPWYSLFAWGNYYPLVVVYGIGITATVLIWIGHALRGIDFSHE